MDLELARRLSQPADTKIILCVLDGLGGLHRAETARSELEQAGTPHLDRLVESSDVGLTMPVGHGITPGSGPGHPALFGYDPLEFDIGRGVLEATGIDFELGPNDVAARGNFCTVDELGNIIDRRAGRVPTPESTLVVEKLRSIKLEGVEVFVEPVREHRFVLVLRGEGLEDGVADTDPQKLGVPPLDVEATREDSERTAVAVREFVVQARQLMRDELRANGLLLRGFSKYPRLPQVADIWNLRAAALAQYPMYRGLARIAGMESLPCPGGLEEQALRVRERWNDFDYFFVHYKPTDAAGEDGDFDRKVDALEKFDEWLPSLLDMEPDVLMVAGDHSTPSLIAAHSWHPVPFLLHSRWAREHGATSFSESECLKGSLGIFPQKEVMPLAMAAAGRLKKYGA